MKVNSAITLSLISTALAAPLWTTHGFDPDANLVSDDDSSSPLAARLTWRLGKYEKSDASPETTGSTKPSGDNLLASRGEGQAEGGALERRFFPAHIIEQLINFLKEKFGLNKVPADAPATARRDLPAPVPQGFDGHTRSSVVARDGEGTVGNALGRRAIPPLFVGGLAIVWLTSLGLTLAEVSKQKNNEARDLGSQIGPNSPSNPDLATLQVPDEVEKYFREHTLLEAIEAIQEYMPEGLQDFSSRLVARDVGGSSGTSPKPEDLLSGVTDLGNLIIDLLNKDDGSLEAAFENLGPKPEEN